MHHLTGGFGLSASGTATRLDCAVFADPGPGVVRASVTPAGDDVQVGHDHWGAM